MAFRDSGWPAIEEAAVVVFDSGAVYKMATGVCTDSKSEYRNCWAAVASYAGSDWSRARFGESNRKTIALPISRRKSRESSLMESIRNISVCLAWQNFSLYNFAISEEIGATFRQLHSNVTVRTEIQRHDELFWNYKFNSIL